MSSVYNFFQEKSPLFLELVPSLEKNKYMVSEGTRVAR